VSVAPFQHSRTSGLDTLQTSLNDFAGRGIVVPVPLTNAYYGGTNLHGLVGSGSWGGIDSAYLANALNCTAVTTTAGGTSRQVTASTLAAVPFIHDNGGIIVRAGFRVETGGAGSTAVLGIYDSVDDRAGNIYPGNLKWTSSEFTTTAGTTTHEGVPNLILTPGRVYWAVYHCKATAPFLGTLPVAGTGTILGASAGVGGITQSTHISVARTYNATLPSLFPSGATSQTTTPPAIFIGYTFPTGSTQTITVPGPVVSEGGWVVRRAVISAGTSKKSGTNARYLAVKVQIRDWRGAEVFGTFDTREATLEPGLPFSMTGTAPVDKILDKNDSLEVLVQQTGWPVVPADDCTVSFTLARERP